jgi:serine/threonine protein kinase
VAKGPKRFGDRWEVVETLGEGGQAHTFRVRDLADGSTGWVLKRLKNPKRLDRFLREIDALRKLKSEHIPAIEDFAVSDEPNGVSYLVTRYVGTDLDHSPPESLEPQALLERFHGIVAAVYDAHSKGVVHRDIKPDNVTLDASGNPFLVDFGICADDGSEVILTTSVEAFGNRAFAAPECEAGSVDDCREPGDVYSLGKLLYWMATSGGNNRFIRREDFNRDNLDIPESIARQYISVLIGHTVREDHRTRWSVTELLERIDWTLAKLAEHAAIEERGLTVLVDNFGPNDTCYENSSRSVKTGYGDPPADYDLAHAFLVSETAAFDRLDIRLARRSGSGEVEIALIRGGDEVPSVDPNDVVERWHRQVTAPRDALEVLELSSDSSITLGPQEVYWVRVVACGDNSVVEWMSGAIELAPQLTRFADRARTDEWAPRISHSGPQFAFRVIARPVLTVEAAPPG